MQLLQPRSRRGHDINGRDDVLFRIHLTTSKSPHCKIRRIQFDFLMHTGTPAEGQHNIAKMPLPFYTVLRFKYRDNVQKKVNE